VQELFDVFVGIDVELSVAKDVIKKMVKLLA